MALFSLIARLGLNASGFETGLKRSESSAKRFAGNVKSQIAAAFGASAIMSMARNVIELGGHFSDLAARTGIGTDALQEFDYAAKMNGATVEQVIGAVEKLARAQVDALTGNAESLAAFQRLGVTLDALKSKRAEDLFKLIALSLDGARLNSVQVNDALALMGKSAGSLMPMMVDGFKKSAEEAHRLGAIINSIDLKRLADADDMITKAKSMGTPILAALVGTSMQQLGLWGTLAEKLQPLTGTGVFGRLANFYGEHSVARDIEATASSAPQKPALPTMPSIAAMLAAKSKTGTGHGPGAASANSLQQIGAFAASNPALLKHDITNRLLMSIDRKTKPAKQPDFPPEW